MSSEPSCGNYAPKDNPGRLASGRRLVTERVHLRGRTGSPRGVSALACMPTIAPSRAVKIIKRSSGNASSSNHRGDPIRIVGCRDEFPPPRSLEGRVAQLPLQPTSFVGRERDLEQLCLLLGRKEVRLLTLTGAGGIGKTRLALQTASRSAEQYPAGVFFVELATIRDPGLVFPAIAQALRIETGGSASPRDRLLAFLRERELLLVLDNFEQLRAAAAETLGPLLDGCPRLKLLVTSRARVGLAAEFEYPVSPLEPSDRGSLDAAALVREDAVQLFGQRARCFRVSKSPRRMSVRSPTSAGGWTVCRWRSNLQRLGSSSCHRRHCLHGSSSVLTRWARAP